MRKTLTTLFLFSIFTVDKSYCDATEDLVGSGYNQDNTDDGDTMDGVLETQPKEDGSKLDSNQLKELAQETEMITIGKHKSVLANKDIFAAVIAGAVLGAVVACALAATLIFKWQKCGDGRSAAGHQTTSHC
ncbi:uncharacterized protein LOC144039844 [Vanacampus margaritifer]